MANYPEGATDVTSSAAMEELGRTLERVPGPLAVDVEMDSMHAFRARLCYLQLATEREVFLVDTLVPGLSLAPLAQAFADPTRTKFFHAAQGDLQFLAEAGVRVQGLFDTHRAATLLGWPKVGLADLVREKFQIELSKQHQQADFSQRPLPPELRAYIAEDVRYLVQVGQWVEDACRAADVMEEVQLDCQRLCDEAQARPDVSEASPRVPKQGSAKQQLVALALSRALHRLRLQWAEAADVPMGKMLSNAAIVAISTGQPKGLRELAKCQGVRGQVVREHGEEILALITELTGKAERGQLEAEGPPRPPLDPKRKKREETLRTWRTEKALARKVTPSVVLTNPLIDALASHPPASAAELGRVPYFGEKRLRLYGDELTALLK